MNRLKILYVLVAVSSLLASCSKEIDQPVIPESTLAPDEEYLTIALAQPENEDLRRYHYEELSDEHSRNFGLIIQPRFRYENTSMIDGYYTSHASEIFTMPEAINRPSYKNMVLDREALAHVRITYLDSLIYEGDKTLSFNERGYAYGTLKIKLKKERLEYIKLGKPEEDLHKMFNDMEEVAPYRKELETLQQKIKELTEQYQALFEEAKKDPSIGDQIMYWLENGDSPSEEDNSPAAQMYRQLRLIGQRHSQASALIRPLEHQLSDLYYEYVRNTTTGLRISIFVYGDGGELDPSGKYRYKAPYQQWGYLGGGKSIGKAPKTPFFGSSYIHLRYIKPSPTEPSGEAYVMLQPFGAISRTYIANLSNEAVDVRSVSMPQLNLDGELLIDKRKGRLEFPSPTTNTGGIIPLNITVPAFSHAVVYHWFPAISGAPVPNRQGEVFEREFTLGNGKIIKPEPQNYVTIDGFHIKRSAQLDGHPLNLATLAARSQRQGIELEAGTLYIVGKNPYLKSQEGVNRLIFPIGNSTAYPPADGTVSYFAH